MGSRGTQRSSLNKVLLNSEQEFVGLIIDRACHEVFPPHAPTRKLSYQFASVERVHEGLLPAPVHVYSLVLSHAHRGLLRTEISRMP